MTDFYSQNRCVCSTRSHGPLLCAFCLSIHFNFERYAKNFILKDMQKKRHFERYMPKNSL